MNSLFRLKLNHLIEFDFFNDPIVESRSTSIYAWEAR